MNIKNIILGGIAAIMALSSIFPVFTVSAAEPDTNMRDISTMELVRDMGIGINLGNTLESAGDWIAQYTDRSVHAYETAWGSPDVTKEMIQGYADEGFGVLRIPVAWTNRMEDDGTYTFDEEWVDRVTQVVDWTLEANMYAIINIHWDYGWVSDFPEKHDECMRRFTRYWEQISDHFKDYGDHLMFEAQNEELGWNSIWNKWMGPAGKETSYAMVNEINQRFVDTVRSSGGNNSQRHLLVSGYNTDIELTCDPLFKVPDDPANRLAVSVHYYTPTNFAILEEDADWGKAWSTWGTQQDFDELERNMDTLKTTFIDKGIPVIIGEYGCTLKNKEMDSVRLFLSSVCREAYERQLCPVLWDTTGGMYDRNEYHLTDAEVKKAFSEIAGDNIPANKGGNTEIKVPGDVNDDGAFNVSDVVLLQKWLLAVPDTHLANWRAADFCEDEKLDVFDLCLMKRTLIEQSVPKLSENNYDYNLLEKYDNLTKYHGRSQISVFIQNDEALIMWKAPVLYEMYGDIQKIISIDSCEYKLDDSNAIEIIKSKSVYYYGESPKGYTYCVIKAIKEGNATLILDCDSGDKYIDFTIDKQLNISLKDSTDIAYS